MDAIIEAYKRDVDRTLIRENLKRTVEERIVALIAHNHLTEELRRGVQEARKR